jgi:dTDP-4-dehydrorhamnose reductase
MKILVLGHKGMLGHMVYKYFNEKTNYEILTINSRWSDENFVRNVLSFNGDYIINCIGAIHQKTKNFEVNVDLPIWLDNNCNKSRLIHSDTDFEMDNSKYGISKKNAYDYITKFGQFTKIIKTSIFGPELNGKNSLFEWFMNSKNEIYGWSENYWNGITTLQWSIISHDMILNWDKYSLTNIPSTKCISKYELLNLIKDVFNKKIIIHKNSDMIVNRCLKGTLKVSNIRNQIVELKEFYYGN